MRLKTNQIHNIYDYKWTRAADLNDWLNHVGVNRFAIGYVALYSEGKRSCTGDVRYHKTIINSVQHTIVPSLTRGCVVMLTLLMGLSSLNDFDLKIEGRNLLWFLLLCLLKRKFVKFISEINYTLIFAISSKLNLSINILQNNITNSSFGLFQNKYNKFQKLPEHWGFRVDCFSKQK